MDPSPVQAYKHPKHSRILEEHDAKRIQRTENTITAAKKAIERAGELVHQSGNLIKRARQPEKD
jgi:hypothetical protein